MHLLSPTTLRVVARLLVLALPLAAGVSAASVGCATPASSDAYSPLTGGSSSGSSSSPAAASAGLDATAPVGVAGDSGTGDEASGLDAAPLVEFDAASAPWSTGVALPPATQDPGDVDAGYTYLVSGGYFGCGIPSRFFNLVSPFASLAGIPNQPLPDRNVSVGGNPLPYNWNLATDPDPNAGGLQVVYMNCLQCHAGMANGKLVVGLGNVDADWTQNLGAAAGAANLLGILGPSPA
ncbi:MAG: hypothetical protein ACRENE_15240, partial [Polyangiaceae bacterium]